MFPVFECVRQRGGQKMQEKLKAWDDWHSGSADRIPCLSREAFSSRNEGVQRAWHKQSIQDPLHGESAGRDEGEEKENAHDDM